MRHVVLVLGALLLVGLTATYALQEATNEVMGPGIEQATANVEAFAAAQSIPTETGDPLPEVTAPNVDAWYGEDAPADGATGFNEDDLPAE
jgi:hypothetical protein